jgi:hypothetical protein
VPPIFSKLLAGGLSAAVVLLWYPLFFPTDSIESWLIRGVVITLVFEVLVHALAPLETALWDTARAKQVRASAARLRRTERPLRSRSLVAVCALAVPVALMSLAPPHPLSHPAGSRTAVRHVTEVKRVVKVERRTVAMAARPTTSGVQSPAATPEPPSAHYTPSPKRRGAATSSTTNSGKSTGTKHTGGNSSSNNPSSTSGTAGTSGDPSTTPAPSNNQSTTAVPAPTSADTTAQPQPRVVAPRQTA